jgi:hypothetical protein
VLGAQAFVTLRVLTPNRAAAADWLTFRKFAEGSKSVRSPCRIFASSAAIIDRCDSFKCRR